MSYEIESWLGDHDVWYANTWIGGPIGGIPVKGRGGTREEAIAEVEKHVAERLALHRSREDSLQVHKVEIIPEGAGVRVLETEEEGDDDI
jgi:hypothetical protein